MRHESLFFLFSPVTRIKGVGGSVGKTLQNLLPAATNIAGSSVPIVRDLLFHLPSGIVDRRFTCALREAPENVVATFVVKVEDHQPPKAFRRGGRKPYKVVCSNDTGEITLVFFNAREDYIKQALPVGAKRVISGRVEKFDFQLQMTHPDIIAPVEKLEEVQKPEPVYPLTVGLTSRRIARLVEDAMAKLPSLAEWLDEKIIATRGWRPWKEALWLAHHPQTQAELEPTAPARMRLAYDEILAHQLHLALLRRKMQQQPGEIIKGTGALSKPLLQALPFQLTEGQKKVAGDIYADMESGRRMVRLLQGDVGSGKTVVALLAMLRAAEQGLQAAFMVPTEIVADQHYETLSGMCAPLGIKIVLLTGSVKGKHRQEALQEIACGEANIVIGTHALFQEHVEFKNLALVVIDEQHRFGVDQRMALTAKGTNPHLLHMTATPIPRSLTMMLYGDMDCSLLTEKPAGRQPIVTRAIPLARYGEMMERMQAALDRGEKAYWICPMIETTQQSELWNPEKDLAAAETRYKEFNARFGDVVGMVHGRMKSDKRDEVMHAFAAGHLKLLVATTVVEVGVDVKDATIMVIERAERFGLSQLHQLRGRVGRGDKQSACVLLYGEDKRNAGLLIAEEKSPVLTRLNILRDTDDGFKIAEADLAQRGGGDLLGTRQSGLPRFVFTDFARHQHLLSEARDDAAQFLKDDPELKSQRGQALHVLLQLFAYE